jgi:thioredoxin-like negative regulator of GroEL
MNIVKVNTYQQILSGMSYGNRRHAVVKIGSGHCKACKKLSERLYEKTDLEIDVYEVNHDENKAISRLFGVRMLPTAIFFEDAVPMARMTGLKEADDFFQTVDDVVIRECSVINWHE